MQLKDFVNTRVETVEPNDTLQCAAEKMKELGVGSLPVCDNGHLAGVITDRDIIVRAIAKGSDPAIVMVREVMTPEVLWCFEDDEGRRSRSDHARESSAPNNGSQRCQ